MDYCNLVFRFFGSRAGRAVRTSSEMEWGGCSPSTVSETKSRSVAKEKARSKANLCSAAEQGGNARIAQCLTDEGKETEQDYLAYIRAIGALRRLPGQSGQRLPFDLAEEAWQTYRDRSCTSMANQWEGGDQAPVAYSDCRLRLTWNHMNELDDLCSDLWH